MKKIILSAILASCVSTAYANTTEREAFWYDSDGSVITDGQGNCLRTEFWEEKDGICPSIPKSIEKSVVAKQILIPQEQKEIKTEVINDTLLFSLNSHLLSKNAKNSLDELAKKINNSSKKIQLIIVEGHTDNTGTKEYNQYLSEKRAEAVKKALIQRGVESSKITTIGYGFNKPISSNKTKQGRSENRRVDIKVELK